jgi:hypothetical protein
MTTWAVSLAGIALATSLTATPADAAQKVVKIQLMGGEEVIRSCGDALMGSKSMVPNSANIVFEIAVYDDAEEEKDNRDTRNADRIQVTTQRDLGNLAQQPFVFRDAQHYMAFLKSGEARKLAQRSFSDTGVGVAYGGFYQVFSRAAAVTEPKHFYGRTIGGDARSFFVFREFGAKPGWGATASIVGATDPDREFEWMRKGNVNAQILEDPLIDVRDKASQSAKYVGLISSVLREVYFRTPKRQYAAWVDGAAAACSATNYDTELKALESLKQAGLTVVPFNRRAMIEVARRHAVTNEHSSWTVAEYDHIAQFDETPSEASLPSEILAKLVGKARKDADKFDEQAVEKVRKADADHAQWNKDPDND